MDTAFLLLIFFFDVSDCPVDVMQEGVCHTEEFGYALGKVIGTDKLIGGGMQQAEGFETEILRILRFLLKTLGVALQCALMVKHEDGSHGADDVVKVAATTDNVFAQHLQHLGITTGVARSQHVTIGIAIPTGTDVKVIA